MKRQDAIKAFIKSLEHLDHSKSFADNFRNFIDFALWMFNPVKDAAAYKEVEHIDKGYDTDKARYMVEMLNYWSFASDNDGLGFYDALGDIFMEHISYGKLGQFFTPQPICDMMAQFTHEGIKDDETVYDPTCGSGRTLLAVAKINRKCIFFGADIDLLCCKMTLLNMLANSMKGFVYWMDSLGNKIFAAWKVYLVLMDNGYYLPQYIKLDVSKIPVEEMKPPPKSGQITLF